MMEAGEPRAPLTGVKVLDLTSFLSGPYATQIFADLGADVVKVEPPAGDSSRSIPPHFLGGDSAYFLSVNRNKRSIVLDLKTADAVARLVALAERADVVIENFRPGVLDRLGLTYDAIRATNHGVIWCSISGFGQDGPYRDRPAYDMVVQALSGGMSMTGMPDGEAVRSAIPIGDLCAGMYAVIGTLAALTQRAETGVGRRVDVAMLDCQISMLSYQGSYHLLAGANPGRQGRMHDSIPTYRAFTASDGEDVMVTANTETMWRRLCAALGTDELADDERFRDGRLRQHNRDELAPQLEKAFLGATADSWITTLNTVGVPAARVNSVAQALNDPQVQHRNMVVEVQDEHRGPLRLLGAPIKFDGTDRSGQFTTPPTLNEHEHEVLRDWLSDTPAAHPGAHD